MSILLSNEIKASVVNELKNASKSVQIITAYCKEATLKYLSNYISDSVQEKRLLVRFRMDDILKGSSDFSILEYGMKTGWDVFVRFDLHAKTYIVDNKRGLVGSANATNSGLGIGRNSNMEMATLVDIEGKDIEKINKLFNDAVIVNQSLIDSMEQQLEDVERSTKRDGHIWDEKITKLFNPDIDTLFSYELPDDFKLEPGEYFSFLDEVYTDIESFKASFRWSNAYMWLIGVLKKNNGCMYFGALTVQLHNSLITDPKPYRRDVKLMLSNLLTLIEKLEMEEIVIDRPNYSQRVMLSKQ